MNNEIKINVPEGMEIDKEHSTFECIKLKSIKKELPKTWLEFCRNNPIKDGEFFIDDNSEILEAVPGIRGCILDANSLPSEKYAKAMLALCKLIQLRDCYNDGWKPDWSNNEGKAVIRGFHNTVQTTVSFHYSYILSFKTTDLRNTFLYNFRDLIEQAKLLL